MKKIFKRKSSPAVSEVEQEVDVVVLIKQMQQQLVSLEKKVDTLISQSKKMPSEGKHFSKPFQRFDRNSHYGRGGQDNSFRERSYTKVICADCNKECEVPFKPSTDRPVYCKECFAKRKESNSFKEKYEDNPRAGNFAKGRNFDKQAGENRGHGRRSKPILRRRRERD